MDNDQRVGSWRELGTHLGTAIVLAGGVLVGAVNIYVAASLLPTAVADIGGQPLYAWNMTAFLVAQAVATLFVGRILAQRGNIRSYLLGFGVFAAGSLICAASPAMSVLLVGRATQGLGAGLLTGLGYAVLPAALPSHLWTRGSALISAMFGVGNFVGPALGGLLAQFGSWRLAFVVLAVAAMVLALFVGKALPPSEPAGRPAPVPALSLALMVGAVGALSIAGIVSAPAVMAALLALSLALVLAFLARERRASVRVLPGSTYRPGSALRWIYLTIMLLASGVAVESFLPLFAQRLGGLPPVAAGFFAATLSFGWSAGQILSSSAHRPQTLRLLTIAGPGVLAAAFAVLAMLRRDPLAWPPVLLVGGAGIGIAMPHLSVAAMSSTEDSPQAAAAIATVLTMATAFGAAVAGLLVNLGASSTATSAGYLLIGFAVTSAIGVITAHRASRTDTRGRC
ncbi:MAG TPA: MFS transporter [Pseudonocardiaceae bacterium]|nr:MFS transporter [Pseudonocardiaceae bacterium]